MTRKHRKKAQTAMGVISCLVLLGLISAETIFPSVTVPTEHLWLLVTMVSVFLGVDIAREHKSQLAAGVIGLAAVLENRQRDPQSQEDRNDE